MTDETKMPPEVAEALDYVKHTHPDREWAAIIRAELLRLADENAQLRDVLADRDMDREMAAHANRGLAALKARIAEAPTAQLIDRGRVTQQWYVRATDGGLLALPPALSGKRVRLVVED